MKSPTLGGFSLCLLLTLVAEGCAPCDKLRDSPTLPGDKPVRLEPPINGYFTFVAFSPDSKQLAYGVGNPVNAVVLCDPLTGKETQRLLQPKKSGPFAGRFSPDGRQVVVGLGDGAAVVWDIARGNNRELDGASSGQQHSPIWCAGGVWLAGSTRYVRNMPRDRDIHIWDSVSGRDLRHFGSDGPLGMFGPWVLSADGRYAALEHSQAEALYDESKTKGDKFPRPCRVRLAVDLWDIATGKRLGPVGKEAPPVVTEQQVSGQLAKVGAEPGGFRVRALPGGRLLLLPSYDRRPALLLSPVQYNRIGSVLILSDPTTGKEVRRFEDFKGNLISSAALSPDGTRLAAAGRPDDKSADSVLLIWDVSQLVRSLPSPGDLSDAELGTLVEDLANDDAIKAFPAMRNLAAVPDRATALLAERVLPADAGPIPRLIKGLDDEDPDVREKASRELAALGMKAWSALHKALSEEPSTEARRRIADLLKNLEGDLPSEELRGIRAVDVLERIGTAKAKATLKTLAGGAPGALTTQAAKDALARLEKARAKP
jgi:WD40 repeat protein